MKLSRRSWHMRLGQFAQDKGWYGRWLGPEKIRPYQPNTLCQHVFDVISYLLLALFLNIIFTIVICIMAAPLGVALGIIYISTRPRLATWHRKVCPLIELED